MNEKIELGFFDSDIPPAPTERRDAAENRRQILAVAVRLFNERGVAEVTMADIAAEACVGKGTLYRRFAHKGELCLALLDAEMRNFQNETLAQLAEQSASGYSALERLEFFIERVVGFVHANLDLMVEIEKARTAGAVQDVSMPHFWMEMTFKGLLATAVREGALAADLDLDYLAAAFLAPLNARVFRFHLLSRQFTPEQIVSGLHQLLNGLRSAP